jgi:hypothetical protein
MPQIPALRVELYEDQIAEIEASSIYAALSDASRAGKPGFLAAQVHGGVLRVFFIDHERSLRFQELMGQEVGSTTADKPWY